MSELKSGLQLRGPILIIEWQERRVTVVLTLEGDEAKAALDAAGNDLPAYTRQALLEKVIAP